ncbi:MAG: elongation factor G [Acidobacteria bacterium]|nr:elongation factor G [Acidobacteriota bacterium]NIM62196.1 elongation factor G [Acidobacteriota bacterium]NIO59815.1 elongation factor G [Acidobacteriota bacterium]NIQ30898.1 elongation factor G [Acidobacteriota bacterium]NIQ85974.1 elongation factor G [Acidobacteriota bacterium]
MLLGHGDAGKTTLTSAMLHTSGAVNRLGKVDDGSSTTDFDEEEIERTISLQTAIAHLEWKGKKINLIDTPGYAAFVADAKVATSVADLGLIVVEAVSGVQVITERTFDYAKQFDTPVLFALNKMDRDNAVFDTVVENLQERFGRACVPLQLPIGAESKFEGAVDLLSMKAYTFAKDDSGKMTSGAVPDDLKDRAESARAALMEMVAEADDALMEAFFEAGELNEEQFAAGLRTAIRTRNLFPIVCTSALHVIGVQPLMSLIGNLAPAPGERGAVSGHKPGDAESAIERSIGDDEKISAFVFKTIADPFTGKLSLIQVRSGVLKGDSNVVNVSRGNASERLGQLNVAQGKNLTTVPELHAGDIGVVAKLKETLTSDTLCDPASPIEYPRVTFREPAISYAVEPKSKGDEEKISTALTRLTEEDPVLSVRRDPKSGELLVSGTGQVHVEVAIARMKRKFGVDAILHPPKVPYLETIKKKVENVEGKHKKQSGGRGQFGVCVVHVEPLPQGGGFEFVDKIFGGSIPQNYRPAVEKGIQETAERGVLSGNPVVDFRVTLVDGKYHNVDSSEMAFKIAGSLAFKDAMEKAAPTILEPIMHVEITAPEENMGDIMGDLSSRRGKPQGMEASGSSQIIRAEVPMAEMLDYASTLKSLTSDRGSYTMEFDHYEEAPAVARKKIIADYEAQKVQQAG